MGRFAKSFNIGREMAAAVNIYRHNYEDVTARRVWKTLQEHLVPLRIAVEQELASIGQQRP